MVREVVDEFQGQVSSLTNLVQLVSDNPENATQLLSQKCTEGVPVMVILENQPCCCYFKLDIP